MFGKAVIFPQGGYTSILKVSFLLMEMLQKYVLFLPPKVEYTECDLAFPSQPSRPPIVNRTAVCASDTDIRAYSQTK